MDRVARAEVTQGFSLVSWRWDAGGWCRLSLASALRA